MSCCSLLALALSFQVAGAFRRQDQALDVSQSELIKSAESAVAAAAEAAKDKTIRGNDVPYRAAVVYAAANAAAQFGASMIVERKNNNEGLKLGSSYTGAGWVDPFLTDIAAGSNAPKCLLFIDLGGGSLTGYIHELSASSYDAAFGEYKSKKNADVITAGLDSYGAKNTFKDYSRKDGEELDKWAEFLALHIRTAYEKLQCSDSKHADQVFIRQTGKIRHVELVEQADKHWELRMQDALGKILDVPCNYKLLSSDKEALYEGINFWTQRNVDAFLGELGSARPAYNKLVLNQVGSSSTQASTCTESTATSAAACTKNSIQAAGAGVLGALPNEDQDAKACKDGENCFPELYSTMVDVLKGAGIEAISKPTVAVLNAFGYAANTMFEWCQSSDVDETKAICDATITKVKAGEMVDACCLVQLATSYGGFGAAGNYCSASQIDACKV